MRTEKRKRDFIYIASLTDNNSCNQTIEHSEFPLPFLPPFFLLYYQIKLFLSKESTNCKSSCRRPQQQTDK